MKITDVCRSYFNGFNDITNYKNNDPKTNTFALLKILSYFTLVIPIGVALIYGASSLHGRIREKLHLSLHEEKIHDQAIQTLIKGQDSTSIRKHDESEPVINEQDMLERASVFVKDKAFGKEILTYIKQVLENPSFNENPEEYMGAWRKRRGNTKEIRPIEDPARSFFEEELIRIRESFALDLE
jgi:hypothetical protein